MRSVTDGFIMISSLIALLIVSVVWMSTSVYVFNTTKSMIERYAFVERIEKARIALNNAFTIAVNDLFEEGDWKGESVEGDLREFLEEWLDYVKARKLGAEERDWEELASNVNKGMFLGADFRSDVEELSDAFEGFKTSSIRAAVYRADLSTHYVELLVVKVGDFYSWGILPREKEQPLNQFVYFTNEQMLNGNPIYFVTGDVIDGPLRTAGTLYTYGQPVFKGDVVIGGLEAEGGFPIFENGYTIIPDPENTFRIDDDYSDKVFERYDELTKEISSVSNGDTTGLKITGKTAMKFGSYLSRVQITSDVDEKGYVHLEIDLMDGFWDTIVTYELIFSSTPTGYTMPATLIEYRPRGSVRKRINFNGIIYVSGGYPTLVSDPRRTSYFAGLLTIASDGNVWIRGNVVYSFLRKASSFIRDTSRYKELSSSRPYDLLNIVSHKDVVISTRAPKDLYITASIFALGDEDSDGKFYLNKYNRPSVRKNILHVFGSIVQRVRGPIGTFRRKYKYVGSCSSPTEEDCCGEGLTSFCYWSLDFDWDRGFVEVYVCDCFKEEIMQGSGFKGKDYVYDPRLANTLIRPLGTPRIERGEESELTIVTYR